jgi:hypothetical protein
MTDQCQKIPASVLEFNQFPDPGFCCLALNQTLNDLMHPTGVRIGPYWTAKWEEHFRELMCYRQRTGTGLVPLCYKENQSLARWVNRQRYQYTLMIESRPSSAMTKERAKILEEAGFVWDSQADIWEERLEDLKAFRKTQRHCNVPRGYSENISLANWVKCQRHQYMLLKKGRKSNMTTHRVHDLESIGFEWQLRPSKLKKN